MGQQSQLETAGEGLACKAQPQTVLSTSREMSDKPQQNGGQQPVPADQPAQNGDKAALPEEPSTPSVESAEPGGPSGGASAAEEPDVAAAAAPMAALPPVAQPVAQRLKSTRGRRPKSAAKPGERQLSALVWSRLLLSSKGPSSPLKMLLSIT